MARGAFELVDNLAVPRQAQPVEPVDDRRDSPRRRPHAVGVFDAQQELAAMMARKKPVEERSARPADVQKPGRRRRETDDDAHLGSEHCVES